MALGLVVCAAMVDADTTWLQLQPGFIIAMAGTGLFNPAVSAVALDVPEHQAGLATGIHDTARQAGIAVGIAALGTLIPTGGNFADGLQNVFLAGAAVTAVGALVTFVLFRARPVAAVYARAGQPVGVGVDDGLRAIAGADLGEDVVDVRLDGRALEPPGAPRSPCWSGPRRSASAPRPRAG